MDAFKMKTYADSYLYNELSKNAGSSLNKFLKDFIIKSHRIDKNEQAFAGVIEEIKRHQSSPVLMSVLFNPAVIICVNDNEMPVAFKVFEAKDSKSGNQPRIFIDITGRIEFKNGYYVIRRNQVDKICTQLFDALIYLLYRNDRFKLTNNANVLLPSTKCYVSMFNYILDYLRIIGFSQNKNKISYLSGMFYLHTMIGYDLKDTYAKNMAAKVAGINPREANAYDLFIQDDSAFDNINTFINFLVDTFRLKGLNLQVFVNRWTNSFGIGTEYAMEVFTSFLITLINAYTGSYIIRQRQIETACGDANLVKVATTIIHIGSDTYNDRFSENYDFEKMTTVHSKQTEDLRESLKLRDKIINNGIYIEKYNNIDDVKANAKNIIDECKLAKIDFNRMDKFINESLINGINIAYEGTWSIMHGEDSDYAPGSLTEAVNILNKHISPESKFTLKRLIERNTNHLSELLEDYGDDLPNDIRLEVVSNLSELRKIKVTL